MARRRRPGCAMRDSLCKLVIIPWMAMITLGKVGEIKASPDVLPAIRRAQDTAAYPFDLSEFSIRFGKCQYVKSFDDEIAADEDSTSPFAIKHFVVYRLCPSDACSTCETVYGDYVAEVEEYLGSTAEWQKQAFENMCENCNEQCNDDGSSCTGCGKTCYQYENLEANGLVDATNYIECQKVNGNGGDDGEEEGDGGEDDDDLELYIGPRCSKDGTRIVISLFTDEDCWEPYTDLKPEDVLGYKLSYHVLADTYSSGGVCLSCKEDEENAYNENDNADADDVNEMCEKVYELSGKCESRGGIEAGFIQTMREDGNYENQVENEFKVCTFIDSLVFNSYTETGEINISDEQDEIIRQATTVQIASLSMLALTTCALLLTAAYLHRKIEDSAPKVDLSYQPPTRELA